jgi:translation initiation factor IF-2
MTGSTQDFKEGDEVKVRVLEVKDGRVGLDMREVGASGKPLERRDHIENLKKMSPTEFVTGKVVGAKDFGVFVNVAPGIDGLVHISRLGDLDTDIMDAFQVGQEVKVRVIEVDNREKVSLDMRSVEDAPPPTTKNADGAASMAPPDPDDLSAAGRKFKQKPVRGRAKAPVRRKDQEGTLKQPAGRKGKRMSKAQARAKRKAERDLKAELNAPKRVEIVEVPPGGLTVQTLADQLALPLAEVMMTLIKAGVMATVNQTLGLDAIEKIGEEFDVEVVEEGAGEVEDEEVAKKKLHFDFTEISADDLVSRPPVVTVMGHVDHGKTSLLDKIRTSRPVAPGEAGGITQALGAYEVESTHGSVTFLDTPGHEAFSAMRARGARVTDVAIIVVAADDGVMPQTVEAIGHAKAAEVPLVIAVNKIDKPDGKPENVLNGLLEHDVVPEEYGGDVPVVRVSAMTGEGVSELVDMVATVAELEERPADPSARAAGTVLEANLDQKRGAVATFLVQNGTLRKGDHVVVGAAYGRVRSITDCDGRPMDEAGPSQPCEMLGLQAVPEAGDAFRVCATEKEARELADAAADQEREERLRALEGTAGTVSLANIASVAAESSFNALIGEDEDEGARNSVGQLLLNVILKADSSGSVEAVKAAIGKLPQDRVMVRFLVASPGNVNTSDVDLAATSGAIIFAFGSPTSSSVLSDATKRGVEVREYDVIYDIIDDVRSALEGLLPVRRERDLLGAAEVRGVFGGKRGKVAGCGILEGLLRRGSRVTVKRDGEAIGDGVVVELRRVNELVSEIEEGNECGIDIEGFHEWKIGDRIEAYDLKERSMTLQDTADDVARARSAKAAAAAQAAAAAEAAAAEKAAEAETEKATA